MVSGMPGCILCCVTGAFSTDEQNAQASVLLSMDGGRRLDEESIAAVVNLVSAAVPGLDAHNISLIDNRGHVLLKQEKETRTAVSLRKSSGN